MPSAASSTPPLIASSDVKGKTPSEQATSASPSKEKAGFPVTVTYDPAPASWFFRRGGSQDNSNSDQAAEREQTCSANANNADREDSSSANRKDRPSSGTKGRETRSGTHQSNPNSNSNTDWGMVSDNEDEEDHEGFNFVAVSNSLLIAGRSFEHILENESAKENADAHSRASSNSDRQGGILILDGLSINSEDGASVPVGGSANHNTDDSVFTIPGSDSLPSDIDTISHPDLDEDNEDEDHSETLFGVVGHPGEDRASEQGSQNSPDAPVPLVHRFLMNVQRSRRLRLVSDGSDENSGVLSSGVSVIRNEDEDISVVSTVDALEDRFRRNSRKFWRSLPVVLVVILLATGIVFHSLLASQRMQREAWEQRLQREEESSARLLAEKESLRHEMELLLEEAAVATARAESLAKEQERLLIQREEAEKAEKERIRLLQEQEQRKQEDRRIQKRRRQQPWRSTSQSSGDEGFEWFFDDSDEDCSGHQDDGSGTFTIADNCWIKAKADINLGSCGGETKDFFRGIWSGLWEDWDYYFDEPTRSNAMEHYSASSKSSSSSGDLKKEEDQIRDQASDCDNGYYRIGSGDDQQDREGDYDDQNRHYEYQDDTYYPPQDPLQDVFSAIHSAGQSFVSKLSNLIGDEVETTQNAAKEMEETVSQRFSDASQTISNTMVMAKEDMREMSKEALSALRTAIQKSNSKNHQQKKPNYQSSRSPPDAKKGENPSPPTQEVTRKGLSDVATAVTMLSNSWQEYKKTFSVAGEDAEVPRPE